MLHFNRRDGADSTIIPDLVVAEVALLRLELVSTSIHWAL